jgi:hypothetical protein
MQKSASTCGQPESLTGRNVQVSRVSEFGSGSV